MFYWIRIFSTAQTNGFIFFSASVVFAPQILEYEYAIMLLKSSIWRQRRRRHQFLSNIIVIASQPLHHPSASLARSLAPIKSNLLLEEVFLRDFSFACTSKTEDTTPNCSCRWKVLWRFPIGRKRLPLLCRENDCAILCMREKRQPNRMVVHTPHNVTENWFAEVKVTTSAMYRAGRCPVVIVHKLRKCVAFSHFNRYCFSFLSRVDGRRRHTLRH